jgi:hypothetical protein
MTDTHATVIVTAAVATNLRELSRRLGKVDLNGMYATRLSASGNPPATHYISSGHLPAPYINAITDGTRLFNVAKAAWEADGEVFPYTQAQVNNALANCTIHYGTAPGGAPETPRELIARLGLQLIQDT